MSRPIDNNKRKTFYSGKKKRHVVKIQIMANNQAVIIHKLRYKKGRRRHDYNIYKKNHSITPKDVLYVFDLGYLGVEKNFPEEKYHLYRTKRKEIKELPQEEKEKTEFIPTKRK
jgi:hypothetical protein